MRMGGVSSTTAVFWQCGRVELLTSGRVFDSDAAPVEVTFQGAEDVRVERDGEIHETPDGVRSFLGLGIKPPVPNSPAAQEGGDVTSYLSSLGKLVSAIGDSGLARHAELIGGLNILAGLIKSLSDDVRWGMAMALPFGDVYDMAGDSQVIPGVGWYVLQLDEKDDGSPSEAQFLEEGPPVRFVDGFYWMCGDQKTPFRVIGAARLWKLGGGLAGTCTISPIVADEGSEGEG